MSLLLPVIDDDDDVFAPVGIVVDVIVGASDIAASVEIGIAIGMAKDICKHTLR